MAVLLNSYATKAYSEHPTAIWPMDDDAYYISLISENNRNATLWDVKNCTIENSSPQSGIPSAPFEDDDNWKKIEIDNINSISKNISNIIPTGEYITITTNGAHKLFPGQKITITGVNPSVYNLTDTEILSIPSNNKITVASTSLLTYVSGGILTCSTKTLSIESPQIFALNELNEELNSFCLNMYMYIDSLQVNYYDIGYVYYDNEISAERYVLERYISTESEKWINFNSTFGVSQYDSAQVRIVIRINVNADDNLDNYTYYLNGLSIGQWSETTASISLGSFPIDSQFGPMYSINPSLKYLKAERYGILTDPSYYIIEENRLLAQNSSLPIIFGTNSCTKIEPSFYENPSFIFPGKGMFFENGRYKKYSLEMWIKIKPSTAESRRIIGPINNDYGVYVREGFISLVVGNEIASHQVSEWYRPMLLHILIYDDQISMIINGENVATISYDRKNISLPGNGLNDINYWGIYSYNDIEMFQVDCISIYPYIIPTEIAKKRFVWGQGTESLQFIDNRFQGKTAAIDFSNAKYTANQIYPDVARWDAGYFNNMTATKDYLSVPSYPLPQIFLNGRNQNDWYENNESINRQIYLSTISSSSPSTPATGYVRYTTSSNHNFKQGDTVEVSGSSVAGYNGTFEITSIASTTFDVKNTTVGATSWLPGSKASVFQTGNKFITFRPNIVNGVWSRTPAVNPTTSDVSWTEQSYLLFPSLNFLNESLSSFYAIFEVLDNISSERTLISFLNTSNNKSFDITIYETTVTYSLDNTILYTDQITLNTPFAVGLNFQLASTEFGYNILSFFGSPSITQVFIGGNGENTFEGKIYDISFCDQDSYNDISDHYKYNGIVNISDYSLLLTHFSTYSLAPIYRYNRFFLDINISAQWEEYFPLSYFASYVKNKSGNYYYDLDYLQLNIGYPAMFDYITKIVDNLNWTYAELFEAYNSPVFKDYEILDNETISHYYTYADMKENQEIINTISTLSSAIQTYITFQLLSEGANEPLDNFTYTKELTETLTIDAESENTNANPYKAYYTKFEFKDGVVVYPPKTINFDEVAIVVHFVINQKGILSAPLRIKNLEITSKALDDNSFNEIGTKFGNPLIPYVKNGIYYSSKEKNPLLIYKGNTPYIYTTENSGIKILNTSNPSKEYGASLSINEGSSDNFTLAAMQLWMMYDLLNFPQSSLPIFEVHYLYGVLEFILSADSTGKRALLSARDKTTKQEFNVLTYYQNGVEVINPIIRLNDWNCIGISFDEELSFAGYTGSLNIFGGVLFNNISYYKPGGLGKIQNNIYRKWSKVLNDPLVQNNNIEWEYWKETNKSIGKNKWRNVYVYKEDLSYINGPKEIYYSQVGVNSDIVDDNYGFTIDANVIRSYTDVSWSSYDIVPI
jgi:hypothetical protein